MGLRVSLQYCHLSKEIVYLLSKFWQILTDNAPNNYVIHLIITMYDKVPQWTEWIAEYHRDISEYYDAP